MNTITVGLFGTCDGDNWRSAFIEQYKIHDINFFNPDAGDNWHPGMVDEENRHLLNDEIVVFPVLSSSLGMGSLAEIGFSVMNVANNVVAGSGQRLIVMIDDDCTDARKTAAERKYSVNARALIKSKLLMQVPHSHIYLVRNLADALSLSIELYTIVADEQHVRYNYDMRA